MVAAGPPYGESLCFTGHKGGRRIIARSYNFFHFYVRRRNLSHRSHAVDPSTATVRQTYGGTASVSSISLTARSPYVHRRVPLRAPCVCLNICHKNYGCRRNALRRPCLITSKDVGQPQFSVTDDSTAAVELLKSSDSCGCRRNSNPYVLQAAGVAV